MPVPPSMEEDTGGSGAGVRGSCDLWSSALIAPAPVGNVLFPHTKN